MLTFTVGSESVGLKGYLDKVEATDSDREIIISQDDGDGGAQSKN